MTESTSKNSRIKAPWTRGVQGCDISAGGSFSCAGFPTPAVDTTSENGTSSTDTRIERKAPIFDGIHNLRIATEILEETTVGDLIHPALTNDAPPDRKATVSGHILSATVSMPHGSIFQAEESGNLIGNSPTQKQSPPPVPDCFEEGICKAIVGNVERLASPLTYSKRQEEAVRDVKHLEYTTMAQVEDSSCFWLYFELFDDVFFGGLLVDTPSEHGIQWQTATAAIEKHRNNIMGWEPRLGRFTRLVCDIAFDGYPRPGDSELHLIELDPLELDRVVRDQQNLSTESEDRGTTDSSSKNSVDQN
ncbi:hypothetical protein B0J14DRAFT_570322 [Halenospora varia]|nr:hypothetical protein B0J14DRAFT_570322 [Halenospora varia]